MPVNNVGSSSLSRRVWERRSTQRSWIWLTSESIPIGAGLIISVEKKEQALKKMMATVVKDKSMIQETIVELDRYKRDALLKTWEKVNGWVISMLRKWSVLTV
jgi:hypothetical protein